MSLLVHTEGKQILMIMCNVLVSLLSVLEQSFVIKILFGNVAFSEIGLDPEVCLPMPYAVRFALAKLKILYKSSTGINKDS
jgi:hypothetical protein